MSYLNENLSCVKVSNSLYQKILNYSGSDNVHYKIEKSKDGSNTLKKNGKYIHSRYSPIKEAQKLLNALYEEKKNYFLFFGAGLAYHILMFAKNKKKYIGNRESKRIKIFIFEEDLFILNRLLKETDLSPLKDFDCMIFDSYSEKTNSLFNAIKAKEYKGLVDICLPSLSSKEKENAKSIKNKIFKYIESEYANILTTFNFESLWSVNILKNTSLLKEAGALKPFLSNYGGYSALVIAGGPSLDFYINEINEYREGYVIIAVDTAYTSLMKNGITPDFVVSMDAGFYNALDFVYESGAFPFLVSDIITHPYITRNACAKKIFFQSDAKNKDNLIVRSIEKDLGIEINPLMASSTVSSAAISFANALSFSKILLIGHDLSYPLYHSHAKHSTAYEYHLQTSEKTKPLTSEFFKRSSKMLGNNYKYPLSDYTMDMQTLWYENLNPEKIFRAKSIGREIENLKEGKIKDFYVKDGHKNAMRLSDKLYEEYAFDINKLKAYLLEEEKTLSDIIEKLRHMLNNIDEIKNKKNVLRDEYNSLLDYLNSILDKTPSLKQSASYIFFNLQRREGDPFITKLYFLSSETLRYAVYFRLRIKNVCQMI